MDSWRKGYVQDLFERKKDLVYRIRNMKHNRKKNLPGRDYEEKAERLRQERMPPKRPNAISALGLLTLAEKNAIKSHDIEQKRLEKAI